MFGPSAGGNNCFNSGPELAQRPARIITYFTHHRTLDGHARARPVFLPFFNLPARSFACTWPLGALAEDYNGLVAALAAEAQAQAEAKASEKEELSAERNNNNNNRNNIENRPARDRSAPSGRRAKKWPHYSSKIGPNSSFAPNSAANEQATKSLSLPPSSLFARKLQHSFDWTRRSLGKSLAK